MKGQVFDIQKFALHDGPGIRTTVFLKGCPLRCVWCCNPESQSFVPQLSYDYTKCTGCMNCIDVCPKQAISVSGDKVKVDFTLCTACGECIEECADNALKIYGLEMSEEEIIDVVKKDLDYFNNTGGGITLSGGEVMAQIDFAIEILKLAKNNNIHTAIETSGYSSTENFEKILPFVDLFLFDYKHTDEILFKKYTGVNQNIVLKNLEFLYTKQANIELRCLIIPGLNDDEVHFKGICALSQKYPDLKGIEVLSYHNFGASKYEKTGKDNLLMKKETVSKNQRAEWIAILKEMNCKNLICNE